MLKKRIVPVMFIKNSVLVQSLAFQIYRPIGCPNIALDFLVRWGADEIILIDLDAAGGRNPVNYDQVKKIVSNVDIAISYGGGLQSENDVHNVFRAGVDKVIFNRSLHCNKELIRKIVYKYGSQAVIGSFDIRYVQKQPKFYNHHNKNIIEDVDLGKLVEDLALGEVFVNVVDRDGSLKGYDIELCKNINAKLKVPLIFCGGCASVNDIEELFLASPELSAAAAGNFWHYTELSLRNVKSRLSETMPIRASYIQ